MAMRQRMVLDEKADGDATTVMPLVATEASFWMIDCVLHE